MTHHAITRHAESRVMKGRPEIQESPTGGQRHQVGNCLQCPSAMTPLPTRVSKSSIASCPHSEKRVQLLQHASWGWKPCPGTTRLLVSRIYQLA